MEHSHGAGTADAAGPGAPDATAQGADAEAGRRSGRAPSAVGRDTMRRKLAQLDQEIDSRVLPEPPAQQGPVELQPEEGVLGSSMHNSARAHAEAPMPARVDAPTIPDQKVRLNVPAEPVMVAGERARRLPEGRRDLKTIRSNQIPAQAPQPVAQAAAPAPQPVAQAAAPVPTPAILPIQAPVATPQSSPPPQAPALPFQPAAATPPSNPPPSDGALPFRSAPAVPSSSPPPHAVGSPSDAPPPSSGGGQPMAHAGSSPWHDEAPLAVEDTDLPSAHAPPGLGLRPSEKPSGAPAARKPFPVVLVVGLLALGAIAVIGWFALAGAGGAGSAGSDSAVPVGVSAGTTDEPATARESAQAPTGAPVEPATASVEPTSAPASAIAPAGEPSAPASASAPGTARPKTSAHAPSPSAAPSAPPTQPQPSAVSTSGRIHLDD
jgi:hypothetical protein